jgi:hypothetical protein
MTNDEEFSQQVRVSNAERLGRQCQGQKPMRGFCGGSKIEAASDIRVAAGTRAI